MDVKTTSPDRQSGALAAPAVTVDGTSITISHLVLDDVAVARYLAAYPAHLRPDELGRAISLGVHGLATTNLRATVDDVKTEVGRILASAAEAADTQLGTAVATGRSELTAALDPEIRTSLTARTVAELEKLHESTLARLDPDRRDSHTAKLVTAISELLGPGGLLAQRIESVFDSEAPDSGLGRLLDVLDRRFQELRDLVVGEQQRTAEAARGTAKGLEFEDELEQVLRAAAGAIGGCVVERTGHLGGTLGPQSKVGDFVVVLPGGARIAVEAKNTARIGLAGSTGILHELDLAMHNRSASWAICVSRTDAYPGEVGSFAVYGDRVLVVDGGEGTLLGVALRWVAAAAARRAHEPAATDTEVALERLARVRDLAQAFSRSKKVLATAQSGLDSVRDELDSLRGQLLELVDDIARAIRPSVGQKVA